MTRRYVVTVERSGDWWNLTFPDVAFVYAQTRRLDQVESTGRRALAAKLDLSPDDLDVEIQLRLPGDLEQARATVNERRQVADVAQRDATDATRGLARSLALQGYSVRDIGELIGISPQRVSQLTSASRNREASRASESRVPVTAGKK
jgi:hypothetical protein